MRALWSGRQNCGEKQVIRGFRMASVKIGDIVEIRSTRGFSYAQYTHRHKQYGALLNVFDKTFEKRPDDIAAVAELSSRFLLFFPLGAAIAKGNFKIVGNVQVPNNSTDFPIFRAGVVDPQIGKVAVWWLWDGEKEWRVGSLDAKQRKFPIRSVWNDTMLIERIDTGWTAESDPR